MRNDIHLSTNQQQTKQKNTKNKQTNREEFAEQKSNVMFKTKT